MIIIQSTSRIHQYYLLYILLIMFFLSDANFHNIIECKAEHTIFLFRFVDLPSENKNDNFHLNFGL